MKTNLSRLALVSGACAPAFLVALASAVPALAQGALPAPPPVQAAPPPAPADPTRAQGAPPAAGQPGAPLPAPRAAPTLSPAPLPPMAAPGAPQAPLAPPQATLPPAPPPPPAWGPPPPPPGAVFAGDGEDPLAGFDYRVFADAYFSLNTNFPKPQSGRNTPVRAYDTANGFSLAWAGADLGHAPDPVGGKVSLRFGPAARSHNSRCMAADPGSGCDSAFGLEPVKEAFVSWQPGQDEFPLRLDFGKFDTPYGVEVAESQDNLNYTRAVLYRLAQPQFHTGLRLAYEFTPAVSASALIVNGWNNTIDNNTGKSYGVQVGARAPSDDPDRDLLNARLGYMVGGERDDMVRVRCAADQAFDPAAGGCTSSPGTPAASYPVDQADANTTGLLHFIDLSVTSDPTSELRLVLNGNLGTEQRRERDGSDVFNTETYWGILFGARYAVIDELGIAIRGEYLNDEDGNRAGISDLTLISGTLTLDLRPTKNLIVRLDNRVDAASHDVFAEGVREQADLMITSTLGAVVTTE